MQISKSIYRVKYLDHNIPAILAPARQYQVWVEVLNNSDEVWPRDPEDGRKVYLAVWINGNLAATGLFSDPYLKPKESAKIPIHFTSPEEAGQTIMKVDMVHQNVCFFEQQGTDPLLLELAVVNSKHRPFLPGRASILPRYGVRFLEYDMPSVVIPGARFGFWLKLENMGAMTWEADRRHECLVSVVVKIGERLIGYDTLPHRVSPKQTVDIHLSVLAPASPGSYKLHIGLVHENVTYFEQQGVSTLSVPIRVLDQETPTSSKIYEQAIERNAWFYQPSNGVAFSRQGIGYPLLVKHAKGCYFWDTEGRRFIDYTMGWGCALLGYAFDPVQQAIRDVLDCGATLPLPHPIEMEVTQILCEDIPCAESVAFGKNGSDVCTLAVRLARATTGKRIVLTCGFHGWQDWYVEPMGLSGAGVPSYPEPLTYKFPFNDLRGFYDVLSAHRHDLAAVMLEPSGPAGMSGISANGVGEDVDPQFLRELADETRKAGALLIFDEIITGFRYPSGSVQKATNILPDLACLGKAIANGMPLAAVVGRQEIFKNMERTFYGPTFKGEIYSLAAAKAALSAYRTYPVSQHIWQFGQRLKEAINSLCTDLGIAAKAIGPPFRIALVFCEKDDYRRSLLHTLYVQELLKRGVLTYHGLMLPSYAHEESVLQETIAAIDHVLKCIKRANCDGTIHRDIEIPIIKV